MSFTERQQQCLEAMGIVPWVLRSSDYQEVESDRRPEPSAVSANNDLSAPTAGAVPVDLDELGAWLPGQALANFGYKGAVHTTLGHPDAPVLVVVHHSSSFQQTDNPSPADQFNAGPPLNGDAAQLFELMLRAIDLGRADVRQCSLSSAVDSAQGVLAPGTVAEACTVNTRERC